MTEGNIDFPLFNEEIYILIKNDVNMEYAEKCVAYLQNLSPSVIETLCEGAIKYCETCREHFEDEDLSIPPNIQSTDILQYIQPNSMSVLYIPNDENIVAFSLSLNCDWEQEHGMEWFIKGGKALYVGAFNGGITPPWDDEDSLKGMVGNYV